MSAFEVDKTHIDVMVSAALQRIHGDRLYWYHSLDAETVPGEALPSQSDYLDRLKKARREVTPENAGMWGALLVAENRRSVNHRYNEDEIEEPYEFTEYTGNFDAVKMLAAIGCYEYQACEHPEWKTSEARAFCEALRDRMIHALPGYSSFHGHVSGASDVMVGEAMRVASAAEFRRLR